MKTAVNPCVYTDSDKESDTLIIVYIDDLLITSTDIQKLN